MKQIFTWLFGAKRSEQNKSDKVAGSFAKEKFIDNDIEIKRGTNVFNESALEIWYHGLSEWEVILYFQGSALLIGSGLVTLLTLLHIL